MWNCIFDFISDNAEIIISICSIAIAIFTLISLKKHNRLSVKPIAYILPQDYEDKICVQIKNKGTGPLITKSMFFINEERNKKSNYLIDLMPQLKYDIAWSNFSKAKKIVLTPKEEKTFLELRYFKGHNFSEFQENRDIIRKELRNIRIVIKYTGIYNKKEDELDFKLDWYGRHWR